MQADFVLGKWRPEEVPLVKLKVEKCIDIIESFATNGLDRTMSQVNNLVIKLAE
jgi:PTH1 family peptidyl-tRNA hydrolase